MRVPPQHPTELEVPQYLHFHCLAMMHMSLPADHRPTHPTVIRDARSTFPPAMPPRMQLGEHPELRVAKGSVCVPDAVYTPSGDGA